MEGEEKREVKVEDRRHFDQNGNPIRSSDPSEDLQKEEAPSSRDSLETGDSTPKEQASRKVEFVSILFSYIHAALLHLGDVDDPETRAARPNLEAARQMIDVLELLQMKTDGNLTKEESQYLENALFDLRLRYVQKAGQSQ